MNGILIIDKPQGFTSFDVIAIVRGCMHERKTGHTGTLDPMATGVLPILLGSATKAQELLPDTDKEYIAEFRLGMTTDTLDITGKTLSTSDAEVTREQLEEVLPKFRGDIMQKPPMYSAVKVDGKRLYQLAREGKTVERTPRNCTVHSIEILSFDEQSQQGEMTVSCEKGTYIRTIIDDIGQALGTGAVMTSLVRTYSGGFDIAECLTIEQIADRCAQGELAQIVMPTEKAFALYDDIRLDERTTPLYKYGVKLYDRQVTAADKSAGKTFRVFGADGAFLGLAAFENGQLKSVKNFY